MAVTRFEYTDSISIRVIAAPATSGSKTLATRKCFSRLTGVTAVHFDNNSFFALGAVAPVMAGRAGYRHHDGSSDQSTVAPLRWITGFQRLSSSCIKRRAREDGAGPPDA